MTITTSTAAPCARRNAAIASTSSGSTAMSRTSMPTPSSRRASQEPFVFATSPESSSFPIVTMAAVATSAEYKEAVPSLTELQERRAHECRLTPDRALETLDDAAAFLRDRGLLDADDRLRAAEPARGVPRGALQPGRGRFRRVAATKWPWGFALARRDDVYAVKIHRGKTLFLAAEAAALADPICRAEIARMEAEDERWALLLRHLGNMGPSLAEGRPEGAPAEAEGAEGDSHAARALRRRRRPASSRSRTTG